MYTVTFKPGTVATGTPTKLNGGTTNVTIYVSRGDTIEAPAAECAGYNLTGWKDASGNAVTLPTTADGNLELTAQWGNAYYTVTFMDGQTTVGTKTDVAYQAIMTAAVTEAFEKAKEGYTFSGWYKNESLTQQYNQNATTGDKIVANTTLYAKYTPKKQYVKLVLGAGAINDDSNVLTGAQMKTAYPADASIFDNGSVKQWVAVNYNGTLPTLKNPTIAGNTKLAFAGWYTDDQLTKPFAANTAIKSNITLYAKYMNAVGISLSATSWAYDGKSHVGDYIKATASAANANDTAPTPTLQFKVKGAADSTYTTTAPVNAGNYVVRATVAATATTAAAEEVAEYSIFQKEVTVKWDTKTEFTYNGAEQAPTCTVEGAVAGETVTVTISGKGKAVGSYTATATLPETGNYRMAANAPTCKFTIVASTTAPEVKAVVNEDGSVTLTITAADGTVTTSTIPAGATSASNDDFTITKVENADGTVTVTLTAKTGAGYTLTQPITVTGTKQTTPVPPTPLTATKISKATVGKKRVTLKWKAVKDVDGYQIQYGLTKAKAEAMVEPKTVAGATKAKVVIKKLKKGKKYYFRIRTYKNGADGKPASFSDWSAWKKSKKVK